MKLTKAIPTRLSKPYLNDAEREELKRFGDKAMTIEEITQREQEEIEALERKAEAEKQKAINQIKAALKEIDEKSIRAIRTNDTARLAALESEADTLRKALV